MPISSDDVDLSKIDLGASAISSSVYSRLQYTWNLTSGLDKMKTVEWVSKFLKISFKLFSGTVDPVNIS